MPQIGHEPGAVRTTSGCIGQTYSVRVLDAAGSTGCSAMPHLGQLAGPWLVMPGHIGQKCAAVLADAVSVVDGVDGADAAGAPRARARSSAAAGSSRNLFRHQSLQNQ